MDDAAASLSEAKKTWPPLGEKNMTGCVLVSRIVYSLVERCCYRHTLSTGNVNVDAGLFLGHQKITDC